MIDPKTVNIVMTIKTCNSGSPINIVFNVYGVIKMKCSQLCIVANRIGGIIIWVGVWNLLNMAVQDDLIGNILYSVLGLGIWAATGEFKEVDRYVQLSSETYPVEETNA